jgi:hypothetical protein
MYHCNSYTTLSKSAVSVGRRCGYADFSYMVPEPWPSNSSLLLLSNISYTVPAEQQDILCSGPTSHGVTWAAALPFNASSFIAAASGVRSGGSGRACPVDPSYENGMFCTAYGNPNFGITSYDNILWAWLTIFQLITQEGWTDIMYATQDAVSTWVWIYYVLLLIFGSFFAVNLAIAVLYVQFIKENGRPPQRSDTMGELTSAASSVHQLSERQEDGKAVMDLGRQDAKAAGGAGEVGTAAEKASGGNPALPSLMVAAFTEDAAEELHKQHPLMARDSRRGFDDAMLQARAKSRGSFAPDAPASGVSADADGAAASMVPPCNSGSTWCSLRLACYSIQAHR